MSAALLAGAVSFSSCSNDEDGASDYKGKVAKTDLAISFQRFAKDGRAAASDVNLDESNNPKLLNSIANMWLVTEGGDATTQQIGGVTVNGDEITPIVGGETTAAFTDGGAYCYSGVTIPLNTKKITFYGGNIADQTNLTAGFSLATVEEANKLTSFRDGKIYHSPAGLYYYGVDDALELSDVEWKVGTTPTFNVGTVTGSTKSIKVNNIDYAVGVLKSVAVNAFANKESFYVYDESKTYSVKLNEEGKLVVNDGTDDLVPTTIGNDNISLEGILVEGQTNTTNKDFTVKTNAGNVYDAAIPATTGGIVTGGTTPNYTTLFETAQSATQEYVIKLICKNNSTKAFASKYAVEISGGFKPGLIVPGGIFYLPVRLKVSDAKTGEGITKPTGDAENRFIAKDYTTSVKFTINSLEGAYGKDPVISDATVTVGVAIDLAWKAGYEFETTID